MKVALLGKFQVITFSDFRHGLYHWLSSAIFQAKWAQKDRVYRMIFSLLGPLANVAKLWPAMGRHVALSLAASHPNWGFPQFHQTNSVMVPELRLVFSSLTPEEWSQRDLIPQTWDQKLSTPLNNNMEPIAVFCKLRGWCRFVMVLGQCEATVLAIAFHKKEWLCCIYLSMHVCDCVSSFLADNLRSCFLWHRCRVRSTVTLSVTLFLVPNFMNNIGKN